MAKKKDQNEDPEAEKKKQFDDDEDFGLPDLEYDALDEESPSAEEEPEAPVNEELEAEIEAEVEASGHEEELSADDISFEGEDWEKELEKELEDDLKSGTFKEEPEAFYEEESYSDFETEETVKSSVFGIDEPTAAATPPAKPTPGKFVEEDSFASPPPKKAAPAQKPMSNKDYVAYYRDEKAKKPNFARTVVIGVLLFTVTAVILIAIYNGSNKEEPKVVEKPAPTPVVVAKEEPPVEKPVEAPKKAKPVAVPAGQISTLDTKTGKAYVIIASFFDGDMAQDHANKLSAAGKSPYIIPPFNDYRFYRVAIAEFDTFNDAKANLDEYKTEFGPDVWPLRY